MAEKTNIIIYKSYSYSKIDIETNDDILKNDILNTIDNYFTFTEKKYIKNVFSSRSYQKKITKFIEKKQFIPTGLINILKNLIDKDLRNKFNIENVIIKDLREKPQLPKKEEIDKIISSFKIELKEYQKKAIYKFFENECFGLIESPVASGKTIIFGAIAKILNLKTLILTNRKDLVWQGRELFSKVLNIDKNEIGIIQGNNIFEKKINFLTVQSYQKINNLSNYKFIIVDEVHLASANTYQKILINSVAPYRLGVSATIDGINKINYLKIASFLGDLIYKINVKDLMGKHIASPKVYLIKQKEYPSDLNPLLFQEMYLSNDWNSVEKKLIIENDKRNDKIIKIVSKLPKPCLILVSKIEHGKILYKKLKENLKS